MKRFDNARATTNGIELHDASKNPTELSLSEAGVTDDSGQSVGIYWVVSSNRDERVAIGHDDMLSLAQNTEAAFLQRLDHPLMHGVVHEDRAAGDSLVELGGDEPWLALHPFGVRGPGCEERRDVGFGGLEDVDEDDGRLVGVELLKDRDFAVQWL